MKWSDTHGSIFVLSPLHIVVVFGKVSNTEMWHMANFVENVKYN